MKLSNVPTIYQRFNGILVANALSPTVGAVISLVDVHKAEVAELLEEVEHFLQDSAIMDDLKARYLC